MFFSRDVPLGKCKLAPFPLPSEIQQSKFKESTVSADKPTLVSGKHVPSSLLAFVESSGENDTVIGMGSYIKNIPCSEVPVGVLTAAHVFSQLAFSIASGSKVYMVSPQANTRVEITQAIVDAQQSGNFDNFSGSQGLGFDALIFYPPAKLFAQLQVQALTVAENFNLNSSVMLYGYADNNGRPALFRSGTSDIVDPDMYSEFKLHPLQYHIFHKANTVAGWSGTPVYQLSENGNLSIIGVHIGNAGLFSEKFTKFNAFVSSAAVTGWFRHDSLSVILDQNLPEPFLEAKPSPNQGRKGKKQMDFDGVNENRSKRKKNRGGGNPDAAHYLPVARRGGHHESVIPTGSVAVKQIPDVAKALGNTPPKVQLVFYDKPVPLFEEYPDGPKVIGTGPFRPAHKPKTSLLPQIRSLFTFNGELKDANTMDFPTLEHTTLESLRANWKVKMKNKATVFDPLVVKEVKGHMRELLQVEFEPPEWLVDGIYKDGQISDAFRRDYIKALAALKQDKPVGPQYGNVATVDDMDDPDFVTLVAARLKVLMSHDLHDASSQELLSKNIRDVALAILKNEPHSKGKLDTKRVRTILDASKADYVAMRMFLGPLFEALHFNNTRKISPFVLGADFRDPAVVEQLIEIAANKDVDSNDRKAFDITQDDNADEYVAEAFYGPYERSIIRKYGSQSHMFMSHLLKNVHLLMRNLTFLQYTPILLIGDKLVVLPGKINTSGGYMTYTANSCARIAECVSACIYAHERVVLPEIASGDDCIEKASKAKQEAYRNMGCPITDVEPIKDEVPFCSQIFYRDPKTGEFTSKTCNLPKSFVNAISKGAEFYGQGLAEFIGDFYSNILRGQTPDVFITTSLVFAHNVWAGERVEEVIDLINDQLGKLAESRAGDPSYPHTFQSALDRRSEALFTYSEAAVAVAAAKNKKGKGKGVVKV